jgi:hypothetical protein
LRFPPGFAFGHWPRFRPHSPSSRRLTFVPAPPLVRSPFSPRTPTPRHANHRSARSSSLPTLDCSYTLPFPPATLVVPFTHVFPSHAVLFLHATLLSPTLTLGRHASVPSHVGLFSHASLPATLVFLSTLAYPATPGPLRRLASILWTRGPAVPPYAIFGFIGGVHGTRGRAHGEVVDDVGEIGTW